MFPSAVKIRTSLIVSGTVLLWASAFPGIRVGLKGYPPAHLVLLRFLVASTVFLVLALFGKIRLPSKKDSGLLLLTGFLAITLYQLALNYGQRTVTAGVSSMLINSAPIWTALMAGLFLGERLGTRQWVGIGIGFCGVVLIVLGHGQSVSMGTGIPLVLLASLAHSSAFIFQKPLLSRYSALEFAAYELWAGTLFLIPFASGLLTSIRQAPVGATWAAVYLGIGPAALAYIGWSYMLSSMSATRAVSFLYFIPACSIVMAWYRLDEVISAVSIAGGAVAIAGVWMVNSMRHRIKGE